MEQQLLDKIRTEEKRSQRRMLTYTAIPFVVALLLIAASWYAVYQANQKVEALNIRMTQLDIEIGTMEMELARKSDSIKSLQQLFEMALNYKDKRFTFSYEIDKEMYSRYPAQTELITFFRHLVEEEETGWKLGGYSLEEGFDSPSFATFIINRFSQTEISESERYAIRDMLPPTDRPAIGDVVFYEAGYAMFYFEYRQKPFVIGMTPIGLASLQLDFGPRIIGYGQVDYD